VLEGAMRKLVESADRELTKGEVRMVLSWVQLNKPGLTKLGSISPAAASGDGLVLLKSCALTLTLTLTKAETASCSSNRAR
jgi:hypothetical protein